MLRIPGWVRGATVRINGRAIPEPPVAGAYLELRRDWSPGDFIELDLPMPVRLVEANPQVEEVRGQAAVMRGPLVYCAESADLPEGVRVPDVRMPRDIELSSRWQKDIAGGVMVVEGKAFASPQGDWSGRQRQSRRDGFRGHCRRADSV